MALGLILGFSGLLAGARPADAASLEDIRQLEDLINATGVVTQVSDQCPASHAASTNGTTPAAIAWCSAATW
jgi:hypothetical protein